jgi:hypothetical protein
MKTINPVDAARVELLLADLRLPAIKLMWTKLAEQSDTVFDYLARGLLSGRQLTKGQPWQIDLSDDQISRLRARLRHTKRSKKEAS